MMPLGISSNGIALDPGSPSTRRWSRDTARRWSKHTTLPPLLSRTCARLCHEAGGELEQMQFCSVRTTLLVLKSPLKFLLPTRVRLTAALF